MFQLIDQLERDKILEKSQFAQLISGFDDELSQYLFNKSQGVARLHFGNKIYIRGLIEFTNYCKNDCYYCGLRKSNKNADRYRLSQEEILSCCENGYKLGFRTFVLQGGEDGFFTDDKICEIIRRIKVDFPDCAVTLSIGEKPRESYERYAKAGADRFLLRHESANPKHYATLHPENLTAQNRQNALRYLKEFNFQVGTGFMVGSPYQTAENLAEDLLFIHSLQPEMVGIGPFIPHKDTRFKDTKGGSLSLTLFMIGLIRLMLPSALIPATTALGTISPKGREMGVLAGANVVMPNLSPISVRKKYMIYNDKICTDEEAAEGVECLSKQMKSIGYEIVVNRGDFSPVPSLWETENCNV